MPRSGTTGTTVIRNAAAECDDISRHEDALRTYFLFAPEALPTMTLYEGAQWSVLLFKDGISICTLQMQGFR